jgi:hypothetical protein
MRNNKFIGDSTCDADLSCEDYNGDYVPTEADIEAFNTCDVEVYIITCKKCGAWPIMCMADGTVNCPCCGEYK